MLFSNKKRHSLTIPETDNNDKPSTIAFLIDHLCETLMTDPRSDLFVLDKHMYVSSGTHRLSPYIAHITAVRQILTPPTNSRPGILVLINDADWELEGEETYEIQPKDNILFVSTLHGG